MTLHHEHRIDELERQLVEATTKEEVELIEAKLNALRQQQQ